MTQAPGRAAGSVPFGPSPCPTSRLVCRPCGGRSTAACSDSAAHAQLQGCTAHLERRERPPGTTSGPLAQRPSYRPYRSYRPYSPSWTSGSFKGFRVVVLARNPGVRDVVPRWHCGAYVPLLAVRLSRGVEPRPVYMPSIEACDKVQSSRLGYGRIRKRPLARGQQRRLSPLWGGMVIAPDPWSPRPRPLEPQTPRAPDPSSPRPLKPQTQTPRAPDPWSPRPLEPQSRGAPSPSGPCHFPLPSVCSSAAPLVSGSWTAAATQRLKWPKAPQEAQGPTGGPGPPGRVIGDPWSRYLTGALQKADPALVPVLSSPSLSWATHPFGQTSSQQSVSPCSVSHGSDPGCGVSSLKPDGLESAWSHRRTVAHWSPPL
ncbi:unnamed protein product [Arctogadus glacialis]